jgi:adenylate cyclase
MLNHAYNHAGDQDAARRAAQRTLARTEKIIAQDPNNGSAMGFAIDALAKLDEAERAKNLMARALLLDPGNMNMRYNLACILIVDLKDVDAALDLLEPLYEEVSISLLNWSKSDSDLDSIRDHPRHIAMVVSAEKRLAGEQPAGA